MTKDVVIRSERLEDIGAIGSVIRAAFAGMPYAEGDEAELVETLRREGALTVSLIAEVGGTVVGQVALSPAMAADGSHGWYALGPLAVLPDHQRKGIGSRLVLSGLRTITTLGAAGCILVGDPGYYARFGFALSPAHAPAGMPREYFMIRLLGAREPSGPVSFHRAFGGSA